jgi:hypothetical protein
MVATVSQDTLALMRETSVHQYLIGSSSMSDQRSCGELFQINET